ncbi:MAG TPA: ABC transporter ATP-binding protein [Thermoanaerobacterales bacterium]|nr:ABC transporter ATP-binding protein [Thermoanaerobacterales bacterium]
MEKYILEVNGLKKYFPMSKGFSFKKEKQYIKAVDGVDFYVKEGETLGLVGESGCGKSTTGKCIVRLHEPTYGEIIFKGENVIDYDKNKLRGYRKQMQFIFQDPFSSLNPRKTVANAIGEVLYVHNMKNKKERIERVEELLNLVGLQKRHMYRYPHEFSGGQRQRIVIARALSVDPEFLICDEPVSALDVSIQAQIINLLEKLQGNLRLSYLFISHDLRVVRHISSRIAVMYLGQIVETAESNELFDHPLHPYTKALINAIPTTDTVRDRKKILLEGDVPSPANPPKGCRFHTRCPHVMEICKNEVPEYKDIGGGHYLACHLA